VERLCRRIVLIDRGTLVYDGEIDALRDRYGTHRTLVVTFAEPTPEVHVAGAELESREGDVVRLRFDRRTVSAEVIIRRVADAYCVRDLSIEEPQLEQIIRRIYLEGYNEAEGSLGGEPVAASSSGEATTAPA
jgi:ABC-2 type transport system ATP-binding protein